MALGFSNAVQGFGGIELGSGLWALAVGVCSGPWARVLGWRNTEHKNTDTIKNLNVCLETVLAVVSACR